MSTPAASGAIELEECHLDEACPPSGSSRLPNTARPSDVATDVFDEDSRRSQGSSTRNPSGSPTKRKHPSHKRSSSKKVVAPVGHSGDAGDDGSGTSQEDATLSGHIDRRLSVLLVLFVSGAFILTTVAMSLVLSQHGGLASATSSTRWRVPSQAANESAAAALLSAADFTCNAITALNQLASWTDGSSANRAPSVSSAAADSVVGDAWYSSRTLLTDVPLLQGFASVHSANVSRHAVSVVSAVNASGGAEVLSAIAAAVSNTAATASWWFDCALQEPSAVLCVRLPLLDDASTSSPEAFIAVGSAFLASASQQSNADLYRLASQQLVAAMDVTATGVLRRTASIAYLSTARMMPIVLIPGAAGAARALTVLAPPAAFLVSSPARASDLVNVSVVQGSGTALPSFTVNSGVADLVQAATGVPSLTTWRYSTAVPLSCAGSPSSLVVLQSNLSLQLVVNFAAVATPVSQLRLAARSVSGGAVAVAVSLFVVAVILLVGAAVYVRLSVRRSVIDAMSHLTDIASALIHAEALDVASMPIYVAAGAAPSISSTPRGRPFTNLPDVAGLQEGVQRLRVALDELRGVLPAILLGRQPPAEAGGPEEEIVASPSGEGLIAMIQGASSPNAALAIEGSGPFQAFGDDAGASAIGPFAASESASPKGPFAASPKSGTSASPRGPFGSQSPSASPGRGGGNNSTLTSGQLRPSWVSAVFLHLNDFSMAALSQSNAALLDANEASRVFIAIAHHIALRHGGEPVCVMADSVIVTWNAFTSCRSHETKAAAFAFDFRRAMVAAIAERFMPLAVSNWTAVVGTGRCLSGTRGTEQEKAFVVHGAAFMDALHWLPFLAQFLGVQIAVCQKTKDRAAERRDPSTPWYFVPVDCITPATFGGKDFVLFDLREEPARAAGSPAPGRPEVLAAALLEAIRSIKDSDWDRSNEILGQDSMVKGPFASDRQPRRLRGVVEELARLNLAYTRTVPHWEDFGYDQMSDSSSQASPATHGITLVVADEDDEAPQRRFRRDKRKSTMADDALRNEIMRLRETRQQLHVMAAARRRSSVAPPSMMTLSTSSNIAAIPDAADAAGGGMPNSGRRRQRGSTVNILGEGSPKNALSQHSVQSSAASPKQSHGGTISPRAAAAGGALPSRVLPLSVTQLSAPNVLSGSLLPSSSTSTANTSSVMSPLEFRDKRTVYRISEKELGRGAAGKVVLGITESGSLIAVKLVPLTTSVANQNTAPMSEVQKRRLKRKGIAATDDVQRDVDQLVQEVGLLARLRHRNIVGYIASGLLHDRTEQNIAIVMEFVSGGSLLDWAMKKRQSVAKATPGPPAHVLQRLLRDTLTGLVFLHSEGIVHRDLKPHNVMVAGDGTAKLADFGTSISTERMGQGGGEAKGTPQYMAPEACRGVPPSPANDVWSYGVLMAQVLTGSLPWTDEQVGVPFVPVRFTYLLGNTDMVPTMPPSSLVDADAAAVLAACWARDPAQRATATSLATMPYFTSASYLSKPRGRSRSRNSAHAGPNGTLLTSVNSSGNLVDSVTVTSPGSREPCAPGSVDTQ